VMASHDGQSLHAVKAIRIGNERCLNCHGALQDAPKAMLAKYPGPGGFGWQMNEIIGAQIVTIPKQEHAARFRALRQSFDWALLVIFGSLFFVLNLLLERMVLRPLRLSNTALSTMAETDALTAVANRRAFDKGFTREIARTKVKGKPLTLLLIDIDFFKSVNDQFGHGVGDRVLQQLAQELAHKFRSDDLFARLGGEEFIAMLPGVSIADAVQRANQLRDLCAKIDFDIGRPLTLSIGVAQWDGSESQNELIQRCDVALYRAKHMGRNRVEQAL
jgi:diguanylate cyclase (GGDEF)-like protein